jgi:hypothetical protein
VGLSLMYLLGSISLSNKAPMKVVINLTVQGQVFAKDAAVTKPINKYKQTQNK